MHDWEPSGLAPGDPFIDHGFLELGVAIQTSLWIQSCNVLSYSLRVKDLIVLGLKIWESSSDSWSLLFRTKVHFNFSSRNISHGFNHKSLLILIIVNKQVQFVLVNEILFLLVIVTTSSFEAFGVPGLFIKLIMGIRMFWHECIEILMKLVNSHLTHYFVFSGSNHDFTSAGFFLTCNQNEIPLFRCINGNLLFEIIIRKINLNLPAESMKIKINTLTIVIELL